MVGTRRCRLGCEYFTDIGGMYACKYKVPIGADSEIVAFGAECKYELTSLPKKEEQRVTKSRLAEFAAQFPKRGLGKRIITACR